MEEWAFKRKVNLLGDPAVGKTSLILRYVNNIFGDEYLKTIGTNVYKKEIGFDAGRVILMINDIMGEKTFKSVQEGAFRGSSGAIAVADITRPETYDSLLEDWIPRYHKFTEEDTSDGDSRPPIILVVNKYDLADDEIIDKWEGKWEATGNELFDDMILASAKTDKNVEYLFRSIASRAQLNVSFSVKDMKEVLKSRSVVDPSDLLDMLLAISSFLGGISYQQKEKMLSDSGIDKFGLLNSEGIEEMKVTKFADELMEVYKGKENEYAISLIDMALGIYLRED